MLDYEKIRIEQCMKCYNCFSPYRARDGKERLKAIKADIEHNVDEGNRFSEETRRVIWRLKDQLQVAKFKSISKLC